MWMAGYGAEGADTPAPKTASVAAAPPGPCLQGAGDLGDTYYAGIGNGGYDVSHYDLNLKYNPDTQVARRQGDDHRRHDAAPVPLQPRPARADGVVA